MNSRKHAKHDIGSAVTTAAEPVLNARARAARIVAEVITDGRSLGRADGDPKRDSSLIRELCYGTVRWWSQLAHYMEALLKHPLPAKHSDITALIAVGLYQLRYMNVAPHAAVQETVEACRELNKPWAVALVNAVLRRHARERSDLDARLGSVQEVRYAHPGWLVDAVRQAWPTHWQSALDANNERPPLTLRTNSRANSRAEYLETLEQGGISYTLPVHCPLAITLSSPRPVSDIPQFAAGSVSVQDAAAQLAAPLVDAKPGHRVLDACAAPGGKTTHLLELVDDIHLVAVDNDPGRSRQIEENLARTGLAATVVCSDASQPQRWWDGAHFDRILLDAPCSATGVIRRHPDIKHLRRATDISQFAGQQRDLLDALWPLLAPAGRLVYATCSILPAENSVQVRQFLARHPDAIQVSIDSDWGIDTEGGTQILPGASDMDGFFYAVFAKS